MFRIRRNPLLGVEFLESRETPAGAITATVSAGLLTITGDDYGNIFSLEREDSAVTITGADTLVNGSSESVRIAGAIHSIKVLAYGGADDISISDSADFILGGSALFDLGDGNNKLKLVTTDELFIGSLTVKGGDGADTVQVEGAAGSEIGTSAFFTYGVGGSSTSIKNLAFPAGQVILAAADGGDTLTLDACQTKGVTFSGGYGNGTLNIKNSTVGPVTMNGSQGPASVSLVNTTVNGTVKAIGPEGIQVSLDAATVNGDVIAKGGLYDLDSNVGLTVKNSVSVTGEVTVKGYATSINLQPGSSLTAGLDIAWHATDALTATGTDAAVSARNMNLSSPRNITFAQSGAGSSLNLTGELTATGRVADLDLYTLNVDKLVSISGSAKAGLKAWNGTLDQSVNVISSAGSAKLSLGGIGTMDVGGNVYVSGKLTTSTGLAGSFLQNVTVNGGVKEDSFGIGTGTISKNLTVNLKDGNNVVGVGVFGPPTTPTILGNLKITTGNGNDLVGFRCTVGGTTLCTTGGGSDTLWMYESTFNGAATINTGAGDDIFNLADAPFFNIPVTFNAKATIDAGSGNDTLILGKAPGDPNNGGGDANSKVVFTPGTGSYVSGGTGINSFDDEAGQVDGLTLGVDITAWVDPT
jgi:hypothetical protein